jgi:hypothetical protein
MKSSSRAFVIRSDGSTRYFIDYFEPFCTRVTDCQGLFVCRDLNASLPSYNVSSESAPPQ